MTQPSATPPAATPMASPVAKRPLQGAAAAQAGYDYQLDVSIFAALRLLLISNATTQLVLEPANEEDLEADLEPSTPGRIKPSATVAGGYKLVVQVKLRSGEPWSVEDFRSLLKHGTNRAKALHHLDDPNTRYLLVTTADAKGVARGLLVDGIEEAADKDKFPATLGSTLTKSPAGRVAIWGGLTEKRLAFELRELMTDLLHVPKVGQDDLLERLRREARQRTRGTSPGIWTRDDLLATVREYGGFLASSASLESFVPPANFDQMVDRLNRLGAVVVRGPSGTGKTLTAMKLCDLARARDGALQVVTIGADDSPSDTRKLLDTGPTLFYVDDPWGQYSLRGGHEAWTEQLPKLLPKAGPNHQYVITSRSDMMRSANVGEALNRWSLELDAEQYRGGGLGKIYDNRLEQLPPALQAKASSYRGEALDAFETPFEIELFFNHMQAGPESGEKDYAFYRRLLGLARRDAVHDVVVRYLDTFGNPGFAAIIWALLAARSQFDRSQLTALQRVLRRIDKDLGDGLEKAIDRLIAARHLRQPARTVSFAHPSVREAFEAFVLADWPASEAAIETLIAALAQMAGNREWAMETAARALEVTRNLSGRIADLDPPFDVDPASHQAIDTWLDEGLLDPKAEFLKLLELASEVGTRDSVPSEVARWLLKGIQRGGSVFIKNWTPPDFDDAWYARVSGDERAGDVAARFVREALPWDNGNYGWGFAVKLDRIATGLAPAFLDAARQMVGNGFETNADAVANGAVRDLTGFSAIVEEALDDLARDRRRWAEEGAELWRSINDGERDYGVEEGVRSNHEGDGYTSGVFIDTYVRELRAQGQWSSIAGHPRADELCKAWARAIALSNESAEEAELRALLTLSQGSDAEEQTWWAIREHWQPGLVPEVEARLRSAPSIEDVRVELAHCALSHNPDSLVAAITATADTANQLLVLVAMQDASYKMGRGRAASLKRVTPHISAPLAEIAAALPRRKRSAKAVGATALAILGDAEPKLPVEALEKIVPIMLASGAAAGPAISRWLAKAQHADAALKATEAAIASGDMSLVRQALVHDRADARRAALLALAPTLANPLPPEILKLAGDPGSGVRNALVKILTDRPYPDHLPVLLALTTDTWSDADPHHNEADSYGIAKRAVAALAEYDALADEVGMDLVDLAEKTPDRELSQYALIVAANSCGASVQARIWGLTQLRGPRWIRLDALDALDALADASNLAPAVVAQVTDEQLLTMPMIMSAPAAHLVGQHAPVPVAIRIFERVASSNDHRALLLVGAVALAPRDDKAARSLLALLGPDHPAGALLDAVEPLPASILDDLGKLRVRKAARERLGERIADPVERPEPPQPQAEAGG